MKTNLNIVIALTALITLACNNQHIKNIEVSIYPNEEPASDKSIINNRSPQYDSNSIEFIVTEMLITSPRFRQLTKGFYKTVINNGKLSYEIDLKGSPNTRQDMTWKISGSYDFILYESGTGKKLNAAYFSFNPNNRLLYEFDEANNKLKSLKFDTKLLAKYDALQMIKD
jgi:hypothetical protein